jgi:hypothetical protein
VAPDHADTKVSTCSITTWYSAPCCPAVMTQQIACSMTSRHWLALYELSRVMGCVTSHPLCVVCWSLHCQNVINQFSRIAQDPRVSYFGHVCVGKDISVDELRQLYSLVGACCAGSAFLCVGHVAYCWAALQSLCEPPAGTSTRSQKQSMQLWGACVPIC